MSKDQPSAVGGATPEAAWAERWLRLVSPMAAPSGGRVAQMIRCLRLALTLSVLLTLHIWVWTTAMVTAVLAWRLLHDHFPDRPDELALLLTNLAGSPPLACEPSDGRETVTRRLFLALGAMWAENGNLFAMLCPDWSTST